MAKRFGGRYSPPGAEVEAGRGAGAPSPARPRRARGMARSNLLFAAPFALLPGALFGSPLALGVGLGAFGLLMLAAWLTREGLKAEAAFEARATARRPAIPRKIMGSLVTGAGLALAALGWGAGLGAPILLGLLGAILHHLAFGPDPLRSKYAEGADAHQAARAARAVDEAEAQLARMRAAAEATRDRRLIERVGAFEAAARGLFRQVEEDPRDLSAARRYLGVYLQGAGDAAEKYAAHVAKGGDAEARDAFMALLDDLQTNFAARTGRLMVENRTGLDIEIDVLRERLAREGVER